MHPRRVLVADDDPILRNLICTLLRREGFVAVQAANGEEAIALLQRANEEESFDILVLDLMMPKVSGWDVIEMIRDSMPDLLPHLLVISAVAEPQLDELRNVCAVLAKPFDTSDFYDRVRLCMRRPKDLGGTFPAQSSPA